MLSYHIGSDFQKKCLRARLGEFDFWLVFGKNQPEIDPPPPRMKTFLEFDYSEKAFFF